MPSARSQQSALEWFKRQLSPEGAVSVSNLNLTAYPEVTGYSIPTMLHCGERSLALSMARWLLRTQESDGAYLGPDGQPYVFDTSQVLRGLVAIRRHLPEADRSIARAAGWLIGLLEEGSGRWERPSSPAWFHIPEGVFLFCIRPLEESLRLLGTWSEHKHLLRKAKRHYRRKTRVATNSHMLGYIAAGLLECKFQREALRTTMRSSEFTWPGMAQLAETLIKLGEVELGSRYLKRMAASQRDTGGWFGGSASYFGNEEIPWAVKFYIDACGAMQRAWFESHWSSLLNHVGPQDERVMAIVEALGDASEKRILDAGCGKGRYLAHLRSAFPDAELHGCDISATILGSLPPFVKPAQGELTNLPYSDNYFDAVMCVEALEHAVFVDQAIAELVRVTKPGGLLIVIDKDIAHWGRFPILPWEQWFSKELVGDSRPLSMEGGLFRIWVHNKS